MLGLGVGLVAFWSGIVVQIKSAVIGQWEL